MQQVSKPVEFYAKDRAAWRRWLKSSHAKKKFVWLILYNKGSDVPYLTIPEAVEEALCWGWIDSIANKRDAGSRWQYFAPRKPKAAWSKINKERVARMIDQGLMTDAGMSKITEAKKDGSWTFLDDIEELVMPAMLRKAFVKEKKALSNFETFPASVRKGIYYWIISAKRVETINNRVKETVTLASKNVRANQWVKKVSAKQ